MSISSKTAEMIVKQLIYDSCMIVEKGTIISIQYDIQYSHKKHDGMIVVFQIFFIVGICLSVDLYS